jgi:hypothetical protein
MNSPRAGRAVVGGVKSHAGAFPPSTGIWTSRLFGSIAAGMGNTCPLHRPESTCDKSVPDTQNLAFYGFGSGIYGKDSSDSDMAVVVTEPEPIFARGCG